MFEPSCDLALNRYHILLTVIARLNGYEMDLITLDAGAFLTRARRHAIEHTDYLPCDPAVFGATCAYLAALVGELEFAESQFQAGVRAAQQTAREALAGGYRKFLCGERPAEAARLAAKPPVIDAEIEPQDQE